MQRRPLLLAGRRLEVVDAGLHERGGPAEASRKRRALEHVPLGELLTLPAVGDEDDQAVVEAVQRDGLPAHRAKVDAGSARPRVSAVILVRSSSTPLAPVEVQLEAVARSS